MPVSPQARGIQGRMRRRTYDPNTFAGPAQFSNIVESKKRQMELDRMNRERQEDISYRQESLMLDKEKNKQAARAEQVGMGVQALTTGGTMLGSNRPGVRFMGGLGVGLGGYALAGGGTKGLAAGIGAMGLASKPGQKFLSGMGKKLTADTAGTVGSSLWGGIKSGLGKFGGFLGSLF